jgi:hypothetical protein
MSKPTSITVGGVPFKITYPAKMDEGQVGESNAMERTIQIKSNQKGDEFERTLLHEVVHAAMGISGVSELFDEKVEEAVVICLENSLHSLYKRRDL